MHTLAVQFLEQGFHRVLFDAMPMPVFVVDADVSILEYNTAAADLIGPLKANGHPPRGGDVLRCINAARCPDGCGRTQSCLDCVIRNSVAAGFRGQAVRRLSSRMELLVRGKPAKVDLLVTCQPLKYQGKVMVLLILEGLDKVGKAGGRKSNSGLRSPKPASNRKSNIQKPKRQR